jgi:hypothetical protein
MIAALRQTVLHAHSRRPKSSPLYRLVEGCYDDVKGTWEERVETVYGRWRGFVDDVVFAFLPASGPAGLSRRRSLASRKSPRPRLTDCGDLAQGFARVYCEACRNEYLLAFSCSRRGLCPSCAAKRGAIFGAFLREEVLEDVPHCM